ncbi:transcriptional regulator, LysR family [Kribbella flavida DSM 17836]|uniref:Transcriptional regulator, LysR family n=1 Tax=Kribbella flavida (strain DSM 17836 / JCM 10339 / NBRC 14399) TaxID=479435 RepID=D2Q252_KRIFD|nr:transcriptional regulator, LysR family [Kribbella flavida DSM 17836]
MRTFVAAAEAGQFQAAADELGVTQQAVSKRIAALERQLGVLLFARSPRGAQLSIDGQAFLPPARELLRAAERAEASVLAGRRPLRIDVLNRRTAPATALHAFHQSHPGVELDVVTLPDASAGTAVAAVANGTIDATFRAVWDRRQIVPPVRAARVIDDPHQLLVGPRHPLASADQLTLADLAPYRIWMPGLRSDTEWGTYYDQLAAAFSLAIDTAGPSFGVEVLLDELATSADRATFVGEGTRYLWPEAYDLRRLQVVDPTPVYPHSIIWREDNPHPGLAAFLDHLHTARAGAVGREIWVP